MTTETMNIHKALCELKILDSRIEKTIDGCNFVAQTKHITQMVGSDSVDEFRATEKQKYQKACDLMNRRDAIKRGVVLSNAQTKVTIGDKEYTVAEAIEMKNHGLDYKQYLLAAMSQRFSKTSAQIASVNNELDRRAEAYVKDLSGGKDSKANSDEVKKFREDFIASQTVELVDAIGIKKTMEALENEIASFSSDVDSALSVSNATTTITIEY